MTAHGGEEPLEQRSQIANAGHDTRREIDVPAAIEPHVFGGEPCSCRSGGVDRNRPAELTDDGSRLACAERYLTGSESRQASGVLEASVRSLRNQRQPERNANALEMTSFEDFEHEELGVQVLAVDGQLAAAGLEAREHVTEFSHCACDLRQRVFVIALHQECQPMSTPRNPKNMDPLGRNEQASLLTEHARRHPADTRHRCIAGGTPAGISLHMGIG